MIDTPEATVNHACDCHVHIYELERYPLASTSTFGPPQASWQDYTAVQRRLGLTRAILVQPTGYGYDNRCMLDALALSDGAARGIAIVRSDAPMAQLQEMHDAGVRGVRFMMIPGSGGLLGWDDLELLARRIAEFGWVINLQLDGRDLAQFEARLRALPCLLTIDHIGKFLEPVGTDHPGFQSLLRLLDAGRTWVKVSAPYETSRIGPPNYDDVSMLARALVAANPERCLWASNWPHPNRKPVPDDRDMLELLSLWASDQSARRMVLSDNAAKLYGFDT
ncbi:D-3-phosphoglycerate dehydrogenase [Caballeronia glathei]|uniref:Amidohydrolase n=1 Tax=Caballeronia glathei TaxID=60547 RepID=A0A069PZ96_9BURK|nr:MULTISPECIES: amidohydrolase family protein [Burkholderiaceae]KDR42791.1 amidohydrolase [Caballeronia glathei]TCK37048.1 D-galactarolactone isomerase [Paraburkholderia sp. BL8N3]CDY78989.1 D-3-phosphoglycerate dehydrogenase [Caballeronia glathei]